MTIKNIRGWLAMFSITFLIVFVFTACSDDEDDPPIFEPPVPENPTPRAVDSLKAGAMSETEIRIQWRHSPDRDSSWFKEYNVEIIRPYSPLVPTNHSVSKDQNAMTFGGFTNGAEYTFIVTAVSDSGKVSYERSIKWATSRHFTSIGGTAIRVYESASTTHGSGLRLYNSETSQPSVLRVAQGAQWHLGLYTRHNNLLFGSASLIGNRYDNFVGTPANVYLTNVLYDDAALSGLLLDKDLRDLTFDLKEIDLNASPASTNSQGAVFFARIGANHATANYAKVIVRKSGGAYLQGTGTNRYIEVVISYQTAAGIPYAKIFAGE